MADSNAGRQLPGRPRFRDAALVALACLYAFSLTDFGAVTPTGRLVFSLLCTLAAGFALLAARADGFFYLPNLRSLLVAVGLWVAALSALPFSIDGEQSFRAVLFGANYVILYFALISVLRDRASLRRAVFALLLAGIVVSIWGVAQRVGADTGHVAYLGWGHSGSYVNRNHFASLLGMLAPLALYSALGMRSRSSSGGPVTQQAPVYLAFFIALCTFLILTLSLGGLLAMAVVTAAVIADRFSSPTPRRAGNLAGGVAIAALIVGIVALWFGAAPLLARVSNAAAGHEASALERIGFWKAALSIWLDQPLLGVGLGTFEHAFANHRPPGMPYLVEFAHNEWLQILSETGLVGFVLGGGAVVTFLSYSFHPSHPIRDNYYRRLARGGALGLLFISVHGLFDFPLHIPANAAVAIALTAVLTAAASHRETTERAERPLPRNAALRALVFLAAFTALGGCAFLATQVARADRAAARSIAALKIGRPDTAQREIEAALSLRPNDAEFHHQHARALLANAATSKDEALKERLRREALAALEQAVAHSPREPLYRTDLAALAGKLGENELAARHFVRAVELGPNDPYPLLERGRYYWYAGRLGLAALDLRAAIDIDRRVLGDVLNLFASLLESDPAAARRISSVMETVIPDQADAHLSLARIFKQAGLTSDYRRQLLRAFLLSPDDFKLVAALYQSQTEAGEHESAREVVAHYVERHPGDATALLILGKAQARTDRWADAVEAFYAALRVDADQIEVYRELEKAQAALGGVSGYQFWQPLAEKFPENPVYSYELAKSYAAFGRWVEAIQELRRAVGKDPGNSTYRGQLAAYYLKRQLYHEAINQWEEMARRDANPVPALQKIAETYTRLKLPERARPYFQRIIRIDPENARAKKFLESAD
ncbi:MAG: O-antigen ligase family protein [Chrysiogenetes bacterium]|nr:O-antigen ligase family protein [Chrysiogenetes bacterium]